MAPPRHEPSSRLIVATRSENPRALFLLFRAITFHPHPKITECHLLTKSQAFLHVLKTHCEPNFKKKNWVRVRIIVKLVRISEGCYLRPRSRIEMGTPNLRSTAPSTKARWTPSQEQLRVLESLYEEQAGIAPNKEQIKEITRQLSQHGEITDRSVHYWFQNRKARGRQKQLVLTRASSRARRSKTTRHGNRRAVGRNKVNHPTVIAIVILMSLSSTYSPPTLTGAGHQRTVSTSTRCNQWLSLAITLLKVALAGRNRSLVACSSKCGWAIISVCCRSGKQNLRNYSHKVSFVIVPRIVVLNRRKFEKHQVVVTFDW